MRHCTQKTFQEIGLNWSVMGRWVEWRQGKRVTLYIFPYQIATGVDRYSSRVSCYSSSSFYLALYRDVLRGWRNLKIDTKNKDILKSNNVYNAFLLNFVTALTIAYFLSLKLTKFFLISFQFQKETIYARATVHYFLLHRFKVTL